MVLRASHPYDQGMPSSKRPADLPPMAESLRAARKASGLPREVVLYRLMDIGFPVSMSTLVRWERRGSIKSEHAWALTQIYGVSLEELLLRFTEAGEDRLQPAADDPAVAAAEEDLRAADEAAPDEGDQAPPDDAEDVP